MQVVAVRQRLTELDSLRGLAALVVVTTHFFTLFDRPHVSNFQDLRSLSLLDQRWPLLLRMSPLGILLQGHSAVVLFFVLSGFVLSLPLMRRAVSPYWPGFLLRRLVRLYIPYAGALILASAGYILFSSHGIAALSPWFNRTWSQPFSWPLFFQHLLFIGEYDVQQINTAFWSLVYEMRVSLLFPIVYIAGSRLGTGVQLWLGFGLIATGILLNGKSDPWLPFTVAVAGMFQLGMTTARCFSSLLAWYQLLSVGKQRLLLVSTLLAFAYAVPVTKNLGGGLAGDLLMAPAAVLLIIIAAGNKRIANQLNHRVLCWLGERSYSLYLMHPTVLFTLVYVTYGRTAEHGFGYWLLLSILYLGLTVAVTEVFYRAVERPSLGVQRRIPLYR